NAGSTAESVNLQFTFLNGAASTVQTTLSIPAGGQFVGFLHQIPGFTNLPFDAQGILKISTADGNPNIVAASLRARRNEVGNLLFSSVPLIPAAAPSTDAELIAPQIVDGVGYTTSLVFANGSSVPVSLLLRTMGPSGQPLKLGFK